MIPAEKAREEDMVISLYLSLIKHGIIPIIVVRPAKMVVRKLKIILFLVKFMLYNYKLLFFKLGTLV